MSSPEQAPQEQEQRARSTRTRREQMRTAGLVVLGILITLFAVLNVKEVKVDWIVGSGRAPLIIVIVVSALVGVLLTYFADRRSRRRR
jgi:uncharacterized integral membrane protein